MGVISQEKVFRVFRFLTVGGTVAVIDFSLVWLLHLFMSPLVAVSIAYVTGVTCHFLLNKFWVFRCQRSDYGKQLAQYGANVFCCWLITIGMVHLCLTTFTTNILVAKLCAIPPATLLGFVSLQLMVFRHTAPQRPEEPEPSRHGATIAT
jgi:putative flippase GtrA